MNRTIAKVDNADRIAENLILQKEFQAFKYSASECVLNKYQTVFINSMQNLITKLALIVEQIVIGPKVRNHTCLAGIDFLTNKVLKRPKLGELLSVLEVNSLGNKNKHTLDSLPKVDILSIVVVYNDICDSLIDTLKITAFSKAKIVLEDQKNFFNKDQNKHVVKVNNIEILAELDSKCKVDHFRKTLISNIRLKFLNINGGNLDVKCIVYAVNKTKREVLNKVLKVNDSKNISLLVPLSEIDLQTNNKVNLEIKLNLVCNITQTYKETKEVVYNTGKLFNKQKTTIEVTDKKRKIKKDIGEVVLKLQTILK